MSHERLSAAVAVGLAGCVVWGAVAWVIAPETLEAVSPGGVAVVWHRVAAVAGAAVLAVVLYWRLGGGARST